MFKNIMYIYWMKISMFPTFINNAFYYFVKFKFKYAFINLLGSIFSILNILTYPIAVLINLGILLWKKICDKEEKYMKIKYTLEKYYTKSKREILINRNYVNQVINE